MSSLETMALLLGKPIINTSIACEYFTTAMPNFHTTVVLPVCLIHDNDANPYYIDAIEKYFQRPNQPEFEPLTYPDYWSQYTIATGRLSPNRVHWIDLQERKVVKRKQSILLRYEYLCVKDGEKYYYQQLLLQRPWRSEEQLKGPYQSYRQHHAMLFPQQHQHTLLFATHQSTVIRTFFVNDFQRILNHLIESASQPIQHIINSQLSALQQFPITHTLYSSNLLDEAQYRAYSTIINCIGPPSQ